MRMVPTETASRGYLGDNVTFAYQVKWKVQFFLYSFQARNLGETIYLYRLDWFWNLRLTGLILDSMMGKDFGGWMSVTIWKPLRQRWFIPQRPCSLELIAENPDLWKRKECLCTRARTSGWNFPSQRIYWQSWGTLLIRIWRKVVAMKPFGWPKLTTIYRLVPLLKIGCLYLWWFHASLTFLDYKTDAIAISKLGIRPSWS